MAIDVSSKDRGGESVEGAAPRFALDATDGLTRRTVLKGAGVNSAAVVWAMPVVRSLGVPGAEGSGGPGGGEPKVGDLEAHVYEVVNARKVEIEGATATLNDGSGRTATTDEGGVAGFSDVAVGPQSITVTDIHYLPRTLTGIVLDGGFTSIDYVMTQIPHVEVVLIWGEHAWDEDLHLSGPDGDGGRFHVKPYIADPTDFAHMVLSDEDISGPEKISVTVSTSQGGVFVPGSYHVWVNNVSHEVLGYPDFVGTESSVSVSGKEGPVGTFGVGSATGDPEDTIWLVATFDLDSDGNMTNLSQGNGYNAFVPGDYFSEF